MKHLKRRTVVAWHPLIFRKAESFFTKLQGKSKRVHKQGHFYVQEGFEKQDIILYIPKKCC